MNPKKPQKRAKVQTGARLDPAVIGLWEEIDEREEVGNKAKVLEWAIAHGWLHLQQGTKKKSAWGDQLMSAYGRDAVLAAFTSQNPKTDEYEVRIEIDGEPTDLIEAKIVGAEDGMWNIILRSPNPGFPWVVLDSFRELDGPPGVAERVRHVPYLKLLESPASGTPSRELLKLRRSK